MDRAGLDSDKLIDPFKVKPRPALQPRALRWLMHWSSMLGGQPIAVTHAQVTDAIGRLRVLRRRSWRRL
jgi:hypothetical protein